MPRPSLCFFDARTPRRGCGVALLLATAACASVSGGGTSSTAGSGPIGSFEGQFLFGSDRFDSTLQLRSAGPGRVAGAFRVSDPIEIQGVVSGIVIDDLLRIRVTWRGPDGCDGTIEGILDVSSNGSELDGPVSVADCGAPVAGRMSFERRNRSPESSRGEAVIGSPTTEGCGPCR